MSNKDGKDGAAGVKLDACPFCGNTILDVDSDGSNWWVYCTSYDQIGCEAEGPSELSKEEAVKKWNRRTPPQKAT